MLVVSLGSRTVEGAAQAGAAFALFDAVLLKGAIFGWVLRSPERIPDFLPLSPKWRFILFGLATIQFARHPEGLVEHGKRTAHRRVERIRARLRPARRRARPTGRRRPSPAGRGAGGMSGPDTPVTPVLEATASPSRSPASWRWPTCRWRCQPGERVGLIGPNGAGKTTFFNCVLGVLRPDRGTVRLGRRGRQPPAGPRPGPAGHRPVVPADRAVPGVDRPRAPPRRRADPAGHGRLWRDLVGLGRPRPDELAACDAVLDLLGLGDLADEPIEHLSLGQGRLVEVGRALMTRPRSCCCSTSRRRASTGTRPPTWPPPCGPCRPSRGSPSCWWSTTSSWSRRFTERAYVLDFGRLIAAGPTREVLDSDAVRTAYLGTTKAPA